MTDEVGFGKPPKKNQFKEGVSGNPRGRPKKSKDKNDGSIVLMKIIREVLDQKVDVTENGRIKKVQLRKLVVRKLAHKAIGGSDPKSLDQFLKWAEKADRADLEGRAGEPMVIRIIGGLPDQDEDEDPPLNLD